MAAEAKNRPLLIARAKRIAVRASAAAGAEFAFDWQAILDIILKLLPLLAACGLMASDVRRPNRLTVRAVKNGCRHLCQNDEQADTLTDAILADVDGVSDGELASLKAEAK